jgi:Fe-S cluster assembly protein SufD
VAQTITNPAIDRTAIEALSRGNSDPQWMSAAREQAFALFESLPFPTERSEGWRRTNLSGIDFTLPHPRRSIARVDVPGQRATGDVISGEIAAAKNGHAAAVQAAAVTVGRSTGKFSAFAQAVWQGGSYVGVGPNVTLSEPVVVNWDDGPYPRLVVHVAANARASILEKHSAVDVFRAGLVDIFLEEGAHLTYVQVQDAPRDAAIFSHQRAHIGRDAKLVTLNFAMGGRLARADVEVELRGQGAESDMLGLIFGEGDQQFDFHTLQGHLAPDTRSDLLFKSALDDRSHSTYTGVISIGHAAPRSEAYQANRNLLLSDGARADTEPKLEILIDDVARCTHGATIGPVDDEQMFYLRTRGLDPDTAARLIVEGFFQEVFQKVGDERATAGLAEMIAPHVGRLGAH